jgi:hypothetical protein
MKKARVWTVVQFGKYKGKTLPQIVLIDPDWFFWAVENEIFNTSPELRIEADDICRKATRIKVVGAKGAKARVEYAIQPNIGKLADVSVLPTGTPRHRGSSATFVRDYLDLSIARQIASYDKFGGQIIARVVKRYVFGTTRARFTRQRCERFFSEDNNFACCSNKGPES